MDAAPICGDTDMELFWLDGSVWLQGKHPLPPVLFINGLQHIPGMAHLWPPHTAVCMSPSENDLVCTKEGAPAGALVDPHGSLLASKVMVGGDNQFAGKQPLAASSQQEVLSQTGQRRLIRDQYFDGNKPTSSKVRFISNWFAPNVVSTVDSARALSTRSLYIYK